MKIKIFALFFALAALTFIACKKENGNNPDDPNEREQTSSIQCTPSCIENNGTGGTYSVTITSSLPWTASCNCSWITYSPTSGEGNAFVTINVSNGSTATGNVMFSNRNGSAILEIKRIVVPNGKENGYEYVDLGLSVKWATKNVGASSEKDNGKFYAWGELTERPDSYKQSQYKFYSNGKFTKYVSKSYDGTPDYKTTLDLSDDIAHVKWGGKWRMPTKEEFEELGDKCTITEENNGYRFTGPNGNSIFMPWVEYKHKGESSYGFQQNTCGYWSSSLDQYDNANAIYLRLDYYWATWENARYFGMLIRPVCS